MLKDILCIGGRPGLCRLVSRGNGRLIVETLSDKKRFPVFASDKVSALTDIRIYTNNGGEEPLGSVLTKISTKEGGKTIGIDINSLDRTQLGDYLTSVLPEYDHERVYSTDIKKLLKWYNELIVAGITTFTDDDSSTGNDTKA